MKSKLIKRPEFKQLPQTNFANVPENIENWILKGNRKMLETFCRPTGVGNGYRFITCEDLGEIVCSYQKIFNKTCTLIFSRRVHTTDSMCPLYFTEWCLRIEVVCDGKRHEYKNDAQLTRFLKSL